MNRLLDLGGRLLIAALFAAGAAQKVISPAEVTDLLVGWGLPGLLVWPAAAFSGAAAIALVLDWRTRAWALALAAYCGATSLFHLIPDDPWQMSIFVKNWAIAGGLLTLAAARGAAPVTPVTPARGRGAAP